MRLGPDGPAIPPMGVGTRAWGARGYDPARAAAVLRVDGLGLVDTAEVYGLGRSERVVGDALRQTASGACVATKFFPFPWRVREAATARALDASLRRLGRVDLYQLHFPRGPRSLETWCETLAALRAQGRVGAVGVSNCGVEELARAWRAMERRGVPLACDQVGFSLLDRGPERTGLLAACRERGVLLVAYRPLAYGLLAGTAHPDRPPPDVRPAAWRRKIAATEPLLAELRAVGERHGVGPGAVALAWVVTKGALPIPGASDAAHAAENVRAREVVLDEGDVARLERVAEGVG